MKVSVLIAAPSADSHLDDTLASVREQTHTTFEVVVVSSAAAAFTPEALEQFSGTLGRPVVHHVVEKERGLAPLYNHLLALATGDPVAFLAPGDTWTPRHLANSLQEVANGADLVLSDVRELDRPGSSVPFDYPASAQLLMHPLRTLFTRDAVQSISSIMVRREAATRVGGFDAHFQSGGIRDFCLRCAVQNLRFAGTHRATCITHARATDSALAAEDAVAFYEKHRDLAAIPSATRRRLLAAALVSQGKLLRNEDPGRAARCFWRAWSLQPVHVQTLGQFALTGWRSNSAGNDARHTSTTTSPDEP